MASFTRSEEQLKPDPRYQDRVLSKFINCVMQGGEKATAMRIVYGSFDLIQAKLDKEKPETLPKTAIEIFHKALENMPPVVEVRVQSASAVPTIRFLCSSTSVVAVAGVPLADRGRPRREGQAPRDAFGQGILGCGEG